MVRMIAGTRIAGLPRRSRIRVWNAAFAIAVRRPTTQHQPDMIRLIAATAAPDMSDPETPDAGLPDLEGDAQANDPERRLGDRVALTVGITLRERNWKAQPTGLLDLSRTGCRVNNLTIAPGTTVWVKLPGLEPAEAKVSWCHGWQCGIHFNQPLHAAVFEHFVKNNAGVVVR